jgi:hypothetical protein
MKKRRNVGTIPLYLFLADIYEVPDTKTCKPLMMKHNMFENVPHHQTLNFKDRDLEEICRRESLSSED